jgi:hypothetical protein
VGRNAAVVQCGTTVAVGTRSYRSFSAGIWYLLLHAHRLWNGECRNAVILTSRPLLSRACRRKGQVVASVHPTIRAEDMHSIDTGHKACHGLSAVCALIMSYVWAGLRHSRSRAESKSEQFSKRVVHKASSSGSEQFTKRALQ